MTSKSSASTAPLDYARRRTPPYLEFESDGVRLVTPPVARWRALTAVVAATVGWMGIVAPAAAMIVFSWRWNVPIPYRSLPALILGVGAAVHTVVLARTVRWYARDSFTTPHVGISGDYFEYTTRGFSLRTARRPVEKVRRVVAKEVRGLGGGTYVDLRVSLRPLGMVHRMFRSPFAGFAGEVQQAFEHAMSRPRRARDGTG